jgi:hypothetical protein
MSMLAILSGAWLALGVLFAIRILVVDWALMKEIELASSRVRDGIAFGYIRDASGVTQGFVKVKASNDRFVVHVLDLRKWTHRQFFPHGSAT